MKDKVKDGTMFLKYDPTAIMKAAIFTKVLGKEENLAKELMLSMNGSEWYGFKGV